MNASTPRRLASLLAAVLAAVLAALVAPACSGGDDGPPVNCEPAAQLRPIVTEPTIPEGEYVIELERWGIASDGTLPDATTDGLNEAIAWAVEQGYGTVRLPAGTYLIGKRESTYVAGIELLSNMAFVLDEGAVLQLISNDSWAYCVVAITGRHDVVLRGGAIRGDRQTHTFPADNSGEEGHCVCVQNESERVLIEDVELSDPIGDGILIVGQGAAGSSCKHVTIRGSHITRGRRQGISIVGGTQVLVEENEIDHIEGTAPQFGIDIESLSYESRDIVIRANTFHDNHGGDFVNCDGQNVWFEENDLDQAEAWQTDGPIVIWKNTDNVIRGNTIRVTLGGSNGKYGIVAYSSDGARTNPAAQVIEDNLIQGGGILTYKTQIVHVAGNVLEGGWLLGDKVSCLRLTDNSVTTSGETFKFREVSGLASGNLANGQPIDLPMTDDELFTNSPPHLW